MKKTKWGLCRIGSLLSVSRPFGNPRALPPLPIDPRIFNTIRTYLRRSWDTRGLILERWRPCQAVTVMSPCHDITVSRSRVTVSPLWCVRRHLLSFIIFHWEGSYYFVSYYSVKLTIQNIKQWRKTCVCRLWQHAWRCLSQAKTLTGCDSIRVWPVMS
jgi:hypothetical protein